MGSSPIIRTIWREFESHRFRLVFLFMSRNTEKLFSCILHGAKPNHAHSRFAPSPHSITFPTTTISFRPQSSQTWQNNPPGSRHGESIARHHPRKATAPPTSISPSNYNPWQIQAPPCHGLPDNRLSPPSAASGRWQTCRYSRTRNRQRHTCGRTARFPSPPR